MSKQQSNFWELSSAETLNAELDTLPVAKMTHVKSCDENGIENDGIDTSDFRAVIVNNEIVACPTKSYTLVQHKEALRPIVEGITQAGVQDFRYSIYADDRRANMNIYVDNAAEKGLDSGIFVGFRVTNSFDRSTAITYGFQMSERATMFELVGWRQVCSNGMKVKVPLNEAQFVTPSEKMKLKQLINLKRRVTHTGNVSIKLAEMQYIAEAIGILIKPFERMVERAKEIKFEDLEICKKLIEQHVSKRMVDRIIGRYIEDQDFSLWGLYNAVTYEASHGELAHSTSVGLIDRSADLLTKVLVKEVEVTA